MKARRIVASRFRKETGEQWIEDRRAVCKLCPYNSINNEKVYLKGRILRFLSDLLTKITFSKNEDLGYCNACEQCPIYYKSREKEEYCPENKWKSIYIPNK